MNITSFTGFTIVNDTRTLKALSAANKIVWPVMTNNSKGKPFRYVDEVKGVGMSFEHNGKKYRLKYHSGCFYPYVYLCY